MRNPSAWGRKSDPRAVENRAFPLWKVGSTNGTGGVEKGKGEKGRRVDTGGRETHI